MKSLAAALLIGYSLAAGWTVCLDAGHGGTSAGAVGDYYLEKNANLDVAYEAAWYLAMVPDCEWVGMTRTGDYDVSLQARCDYANANGFDRFMSIHENAFNTTVQGSEVYYEPGTPAYNLAVHVLDGILWAHSYPDRGVKDGSAFYVIANTDMPAILGEGTFIDYDVSWDESWRYSTWWNDHQGRQGWAYAAGVCENMGSAPPSYGSSGDVIVDNLNAGFTVNAADQWSTGTYGTPWGTNYRWSTTDDQNDWARWTPDLPEAGWYEVYVWYVDGTNRAPDALFTVHHAGGDTGFEVNQTQGGEQWSLLGGFGFEAGDAGWVTLSEAGTTQGRVVIADAMRFHLISTGTGEETSAPVSDGLPRLGAWPNPSSSFQIDLTLPEAGLVVLEAYDLAGRRLETLLEAFLPEGENVIPWIPDGLPAGVYIVRATTGSWSGTCRVVLTY